MSSHYFISVEAAGASNLHPTGREWGLVTQFCCFHFLTSQIWSPFYPNIRLCCHGAPLKHRSHYLTHIIEKEKSSLAPHCFQQKAQIFSSATWNLKDWPLPVPPASLSPFLLGMARFFTSSSTCFFLVSISFCQSWPAGSLQAESPGCSVWLHGVCKKLDLDTFRWGLYPSESLHCPPLTTSTPILSFTIEPLSLLSLPHPGPLTPRFLVW